MLQPRKGDGSSKRILHLNSLPHVLRFIENYCESKTLKFDSTKSEATAFHSAVVNQYRLILIGLQATKADAIRIIKGLLRAKARTLILLISEFPSRDEPRFSGLQNIIGTIDRPIEIKVLSGYLQDSNKPKDFDAMEKVRPAATLRKWKIGAAIGG